MTNYFSKENNALAEQEKALRLLFDAAYAALKSGNDIELVRTIVERAHEEWQIDTIHAATEGPRPPMTNHLVTDDD